MILIIITITITIITVNILPLWLLWIKSQMSAIAWLPPRIQIVQRSDPSTAALLASKGIQVPHIPCAVACIVPSLSC